MRSISLLSRHHQKPKQNSVMILSQTDVLDAIVYSVNWHRHISQSWFQRNNNKHNNSITNTRLLKFSYANAKYLPYVCRVTHNDGNHNYYILRYGCNLTRSHKNGDQQDAFVYNFEAQCHPKPLKRRCTVRRPRVDNFCKVSVLLWFALKIASCICIIINIETVELPTDFWSLSASRVQSSGWSGSVFFFLWTGSVWIPAAVLTRTRAVGSRSATANHLQLTQCKE